MVAFFGRLFRLFLAILLIPLVSAVASTGIQFLAANAEQWLLSWFTVGFLAFVPIGAVMVGSGNSFSQWFEHELGHAVLVKLLFRRIKRFEVTPLEESQKGQVVPVRSAGCLTFLITLAPYYLPLFTLPFLLLQPFVPPVLQNIVNFLIGFTLSFHVICLLAEFGLHRPTSEGWGACSPWRLRFCSTPFSLFSS